MMFVALLKRAASARPDHFARRRYTDRARGPTPMAGEEFPSPAGSSKALGSGPYGEVIDACRRAGSEPQVGQVATQITSTTNLVAVELGASIMPAAMANAGFAGVRYLPIKGIAPIARIALVAQARKHSLGKAAVRPERRL